MNHKAANWIRGMLTAALACAALTAWAFASAEGLGAFAADTGTYRAGLFSDVAALSRRSHIPFLASHSGADAVFSCARNLTDDQLKTLADCGGIVGLDFCADFLSDDKRAEGQRAALLAHAAHILKTGGEDVLALGSDFDGIPENAYMRSAACIPDLLEAFSSAFGERITEKIAAKNAMRLFGEVLH